jgi:hypothetical protein
MLARRFSPPWSIVKAGVVEPERPQAVLYRPVVNPVLIFGTIDSKGAKT